MTDLSKIDFTRLTLPEWSGVNVVCKLGPLGVELELYNYLRRFAYQLPPGQGAWQYVGPSSWGDLQVAKTYTDRVDRFIAEESARIAEPMGQPRQPCCATCGVTDCQAPSSPVDCRRYVREKKPDPRPCTRDFALSHPDESESRYWSHGNGWSRWRIVAKNHEACYETEFRTTAAEPQKLDVSWFHDARQHT